MRMRTADADGGLNNFYLNGINCPTISIISLLFFISFFSIIIIFLSVRRPPSAIRRPHPHFTESLFCMRFSVLADFVCGFAVLDEIFFGFAVSSIPQCPPHLGVAEVLEMASVL